MTYTEIYAFDKSGKGEFYGLVPNARLGALAVWKELERKYLPPYSEDNRKTRCNVLVDDPSGIQEVWSLVESDKLSRTEKIVLLSTFDGVIVKMENRDELIEAFNNFNGNTSLKKQADVIKGIIGKYVAFGWNQVSINSQTWASYQEDPNTGESIPYNFLKQDHHYFLFEELAKVT